MIQVTNGRCEVERARLSACKCAFKLMACLAECPTSSVGLIRALCYFKRLSRVAFMSLCCSLWNVGGWSLSPTPACDAAQCSPLPFLPIFQTKMTFLSNANKKNKKNTTSLIRLASHSVLNTDGLPCTASVRSCDRATSPCSAFNQSHHFIHW